MSELNLEPLVLNLDERKTLSFMLDISLLFKTTESLEEHINDVSEHLPELKNIFDTFSSSVETEMEKIQHLFIDTEDLLGKGE